MYYKDLPESPYKLEKKLLREFMSLYTAITFKSVVIWKFFPASKFEYEILGISFFEQNRSRERPVPFLS